MSFRGKAKPALILKCNNGQPSISSVHRIKKVIERCKKNWMVTYFQIFIY